MNQVATATTINLRGDCTSEHCLKMSGELWTQLEPSYSRGAAVMPISAGDDYVRYLEEHRTLRRRSMQAVRLGYSFGEIDRQDYADDIYLVNTSAERRQGRPMSPGYSELPVFGPNPVVCPMHHVYTYGVLQGPEDDLWAYLWLYRSGELAMVSSILGHHEFLTDGIMYLLWRGMVGNQCPLGGTVFYNMWNSGTDGLRFFKERVGLYEGDVEWKLT